MPRFYVARALALFALLLLAARAPALEVVASIKPLALIAERIVGPEGQVKTLLPAGVTPHEFALRVSDMRAIHDADVVIWVGPELESFLRKPLSALAPEQLMAMAELESINWPSEAVLPAGHKSAPAQEHNEHTHTQGRDPHVWLNPINAVALAQQLAQRLGQLQPQQAAAFNARAEQFTQEVAAWDKRLQQQLNPVRQRGFAVYHDGYRHLVAHYQLHQLDYVTLTPERRPGAKHLYQLEQRLRRDAVCLFVEPYADARAATALAQRVGLRTGVLDPLASDVSISTYQELMTGLATALANCLREPE